MSEMKIHGRRDWLRLGLGVAVGTALARTATAAREAAVNIDNFSFSPPSLKVARGTTVRWTNRDDIPHSIICPQLGLHSPPMDTDDSFAHVFDRAGSFDYMCGLHPFMKGRIVVAA